MLRERIPVAGEGVPFVAVLGLATVVCAQMGWAVAAVAFFIATVFVLSFFRDPERIVPGEPGIVVSPADGKVIEVSLATDPLCPSCERQRISIFMTVFNCHVNRAPCSGTVERIRHRKGSFHAASLDRAVIENEQCAILMRFPDGESLTVVQVAGLIARRIVCRAQEGDHVKRGERFGMIRFGSRLDVYLPKGSTVLVKKGDRVMAGESVMAQL